MKKTIGKPLAAFLALLIMLSSVAVNVFAAGEPIEFSLSDASGNLGDTVDVTISVSGDVLVDFIVIYGLTFDEDNLEYVGVKEMGELVEKCLTPNHAYDENNRSFVISYSEPITANGIIATIQFKIKEECALKEMEISMNAVATNTTINREPVENGQQVPKCKITVSCAHDFDTEWKNDDKNHWHECSKCGEKDGVEAHKWDDGKVTTEPTCTEKGEKTVTCTVCKYTKTEEIPALGHSYDNKWSYDKDSHWHDCKNDCGEKKDKTEHDLKEVIDKEPTEEEAGSKHSECTVCSYKTESSTIPALAHTHNMEHVAAKESTCAEKGNVEYWHCTKCGLNYADKNGETEIADVTTSLKEHTYVAHDEVPADHSNKGTKKHYTCSVCEKLFDADKKETTAEALVIPVVPHAFDGEWKNDADGHWHECSCGEKSEIEAHTYDWKVVTEATEDEEGLEKGVCSVCKYETERAIPKKDHEHKYGDEWLKDSENHWHECRCGEKSDIAAHTFDWTVIKDATEDEEGLEKGVCSVCKYETEREIPKKNHVHTMTYVPGKPATCVATGTCDHWRCTACNKLFADKEGNTEITNTVLPVDPANHQFNGNTCVACGYNRPSFNNMNNAPVYLSETLHGLFHNGQMIPYPHTPDFLGQRTDGSNLWYVCGVCGHEYGKTASVAADESGDLVQVIDVDTPTEAGDNAEEVEGDNVNVTDNAPAKSENPKTGIALSVIPAVLALLAIAVKKH